MTLISIVTIISIHVPTRGTTYTNDPYLYSHHYFNPRSYERNDRISGDMPHRQHNFNPRSYERNDVLFSDCQLGSIRFQSTFLREERPSTTQIYADLNTISIHVPTRGTTCNFDCCLSVYRFQSTFLREERQMRSVHPLRRKLFQSTFLREERLFIPDIVANCGNISIHVPTRGTTAATLIAVSLFTDFNPRSYERNDVHLLHIGHLPKISIHVPTRGTTYSFVFYQTLNTDFNPRSYERNDLYCNNKQTGLQKFQSTFLREERQMRSVHPLRRKLFQSTFLREERQSILCVSSLCFLISIHVPTRGTTKCAPFILSEENYFNPRSYERNDATSELKEISSVLISIHVPTRGTTIALISFLLIFLFQSTFLREERHITGERVRSRAYFNPRSYERNDLTYPGYFILYPYFNPRSYERNDRLL